MLSDLKVTFIQPALHAVPMALCGGRPGLRHSAPAPPMPASAVHPGPALTGQLRLPRAARSTGSQPSQPVARDTTGRWPFRLTLGTQAQRGLKVTFAPTFPHAPDLLPPLWGRGTGMCHQGHWSSRAEGREAHSRVPSLKSAPAQQMPGQRSPGGTPSSPALLAPGRGQPTPAAVPVRGAVAEPSEHWP